MSADGLRALIVARLRAEADRIEAGGIVCDAYCDGLYDTETAMSAQEARSNASGALEAALDDGEWHPDTEYIEWGIRVTVERATLAKVGRCDRFDYLADYEIRPEGSGVALEVIVTRCSECDHEEAVPPGGTCSHCGHADNGAMPDEVTP